MLIHLVWSPCNDCVAVDYVLSSRGRIWRRRRWLRRRWRLRRWWCVISHACCCLLYLFALPAHALSFNVHCTGHAHVREQHSGRFCMHSVSLMHISVANMFGTPLGKCLSSVVAEVLQHRHNLNPDPVAAMEHPSSTVWRSIPAHIHHHHSSFFCVFYVRE